MEKETAAAVSILPDDAIADIFRCLPARSLAASRRVCKAWRAVVDEQQLLLRLRRLLPHSVGGLFVNYMDHRRPYFFARPSPASSGWPLIDGEFGSVVGGNWHKVRDHCNGLVLYLDMDSMYYVCNPATRRWTCLPPRPSGINWRHSRAFLVFDPAVSPDYDVLLEPLDPPTKRDVGGDKDDTILLMEWPPPSWTWRGFSSATGRWEEKVFVRENDEPAGTVASLDHVSSIYGIAEDRWRYAAYWKGALYVQCRGEYVTRLSLFNNKYQVIKSPIDLVEYQSDVRSFLGRSEKGVYFAAIDGIDQLRVWILSEAHDQMEWVLKHRSNMKTRTWWLQEEKYRKMQYKGPWILMNVPATCTMEEDKETLVKHRDASWSFNDDDNVIDVVDDEEELDRCVRFLGFHPYKEIIFLSSLGYIAVAYHLNSTKVQYLGGLGLGPYTYHRGLHESFVYTPCMIGN